MALESDLNKGNEGMMNTVSNLIRTSLQTGVSMVITDMENELEKLVDSLYKYSPAVEADKMPEYNQLKEAIRKYGRAIQDKIEILNTKNNNQ